MRINRKFLICTLLILLAFNVVAVAQNRLTCEGVLPATMTMGDVGYVTHTGLNNVRDNAGLDGTIVGTLQVDERFAVISAPVCVDGFIWYEVENETITGWTAESGNGDYWLLPHSDVTVDLSNIQFIRDFTCPHMRGIHSFNFSQSGEKLLIACSRDDRQLMIYDMASDTLAQIDMNYTTNLHSAHYVANNSLILVEYDNTIALLDAVTFEAINEITYDAFIPYSSLSLDRSLFFRVDNENRNIIHVHDATNLEELTLFAPSSLRWVELVVTDPYNSRILLGNREGTSQLLTVDSELNIINQQQIPFMFTAISPNMETAIAPICTFADHGCQSSELRWLDFDTFETTAIAPTFEISSHVTFLPDSSAFLINGCWSLNLHDTVSTIASSIDTIEISCAGDYDISSDWRYIVTEPNRQEDEPERDYLKLYRIGDE